VLQSADVNSTPPPDCQVASPEAARPSSAAIARIDAGATM